MRGGWRQGQRARGKDKAAARGRTRWHLVGHMLMHMFCLRVLAPCMFFYTFSYLEILLLFPFVSHSIALFLLPFLHLVTYLMDKTPQTLTLGPTSRCILLSSSHPFFPSILNTTFYIERTCRRKDNTQNISLFSFFFLFLLTDDHRVPMLTTLRRPI